MLAHTLERRLTLTPDTLKRQLIECMSHYILYFTECMPTIYTVLDGHFEKPVYGDMESGL